jgi:hemolysin activation/secretion protein
VDIRQPVRTHFISTPVLIFALVFQTCTLWFAGPLAAQQSIHVDPKGRSREQLPPAPAEPPSVPAPEQILPPPQLPTVSEDGPTPVIRVNVRTIRVTGSTVFTTDELAGITAPFTGREVTSEDLEELRKALTLLYVQNGYVNSGAVIPDQGVEDGVITFHMTEGRLAGINVEGNKLFRDSYLKKRISLGSGKPLDINALQEQLLLLHQDRRIRRINAELAPGLRLGESELDVQVTETGPLKFWLYFDNYESPAVGAEGLSVALEHQSLTGNGDVLGVVYGRTSGLDPQLEAYYSLPFTARDATLTLEYRKNDYTVVEDPFDSLDIVSKSDLYGVHLRRPFHRTLSSEFALVITGEHIKNETSLLGEPFSLSPGAIDGESTVTALRFGQEWIHRDQKQVLDLRSRFSLGINAFGATDNPSEIPDSQFLAWLLKFQWVRGYEKLGGTQFLLKSDLQLALDPLLSLEQISVGGRYSVRGYRENELVRDNAFIASLEARVPLLRNKPWADYLQLAPFVDFGTGWNTDRPTPDPKTLSSVGLGLRWGVSLTAPLKLRPRFELYWGKALRNIDYAEYDLQNDGIHFQFVIEGL